MFRILCHFFVLAFKFSLRSYHAPIVIASSRADKRISVWRDCFNVFFLQFLFVSFSFLNSKPLFLSLFSFSFRDCRVPFRFYRFHNEFRDENNLRSQSSFPSFLGFSSLFSPFYCPSQRNMVPFESLLFVKFRRNLAESTMRVDSQQLTEFQFRRANSAANRT